jgi:hypothetical protein
MDETCPAKCVPHYRCCVVGEGDAIAGGVAVSAGGRRCVCEYHENHTDANDAAAPMRETPAAIHAERLNARWCRSVCSYVGSNRRCSGSAAARCRLSRMRPRTSRSAEPGRYRLISAWMSPSGRSRNLGMKDSSTCLTLSGSRSGPFIASRYACE